MSMSFATSIKIFYGTVSRKNGCSRKRQIATTTFAISKQTIMLQRFNLILESLICAIGNMYSFIRR
jgi:hypothetical protein